MIFTYLEESDVVLTGGCVVVRVKQNLCDGHQLPGRQQGGERCQPYQPALLNSERPVMQPQEDRDTGSSQQLLCIVIIKAVSSRQEPVTADLGAG